ncbi:MAG: hypothetical protein HYU78_14095 [Rhodocyclales bacterium]|nr:hypothetical protein [Rhodocyclales bacterium]
MEPKTREFLAQSVRNICDYDGEITETTLLKDLQLESLDYVAIQIDIKRHLGIDIDYDDFTERRIETVGDFVRYIDSLR